MTAWTVKRSWLHRPRWLLAGFLGGVTRLRLDVAIRSFGLSERSSTESMICSTQIDFFSTETEIYSTQTTFYSTEVILWKPFQPPPPPLPNQH